MANNMGNTKHTPFFKVIIQSGKVNGVGKTFRVPITEHQKSFAIAARIRQKRETLLTLSQQRGRQHQIAV
jgi:hypothetical protein